MARFRGWGIFLAGIAIGLSIGGAMTAGVVLGRRTTPLAGDALGDLRLKAMASHGNDSFAIATGVIDGDVEGLFTLDFLTGDLQCYVLNPRNGNVAGMFKTNVAAALPPEGSKKPNFLLATGVFKSQSGTGNQRPAGCVCYVVDANSGGVAAYSFPWAQSATASGAVQGPEMRLVGKWKTRTVGVRDP